MQYLLAIDSGATKTDLLLAQEDGQVLAQHQTLGCSLSLFNNQQIMGRLTVGIDELYKKAHLQPKAQIQKCVMGLAGVDTKDDEITANEIMSNIASQFRIAEFEVMNDTDILLGILDSPGIALIAGTGSNCKAKDQNNRVVKVAGLGHLLADQGSGYWVGKQVLLKAAKSFDHRIEKSMLEQLVCEYFQVSSIDKLTKRVYHPCLSKTQIAQLAKVCVQAMQKGDQIAKQILEDNAHELLIMIQTVIAQLNLQSVKVNLLVSGSLINNTHVKSLLIDQLNKAKIQYNLIDFDKSPVFAALELAKHSHT